MYIKYKGKNRKISSDLEKVFEKVCLGMAKVATNDWKQNHLNLYIKDSKGDGKTVQLQMYGLGKVNRSEEYSVEWILTEGVQKPFFRELYNLLIGINNMGIEPDVIHIQYECGKIINIEAY